MNPKTYILWWPKGGNTFQRRKRILFPLRVNQGGSSGTWVKSCWCFLPSVGKHPFYGLHMPSKHLQLPSLCMYIVNVLPIKFLVTILEKYPPRYNDLSSVAIWAISDPKIPVFPRSPILFSTLVPFVVRTRLYCHPSRGWPTWDCDQCGEFIERAHPEYWVWLSTLTVSMGIIVTTVTVGPITDDGGRHILTRWWPARGGSVRFGGLAAMWRPSLYNALSKASHLKATTMFVSLYNGNKCEYIEINIFSCPKTAQWVPLSPSM